MDIVDFDALEGQARRALSGPFWAFLDVGADDEITYAENAAAWRALRLRPKVLNDISKARPRRLCWARKSPRRS